MAHTKAGGKTRQQANRPGKRLGLKISSGQKVRNGAVLVRQEGTTLTAGPGVKRGRDFTLYSIKDGQVNITRKNGKKVVSVA
jgi:large subunit ribosomal protein L27